MLIHNAKLQASSPRLCPLYQLVRHNQVPRFSVPLKLAYSLGQLFLLNFNLTYQSWSDDVSSLGRNVFATVQPCNTACYTIVLCFSRHALHLKLS